MFSAPRHAVALLLLLLTQFGQAHGQQLPPSPTMPSPVLLPDPGARCSGWLACPTIDQWDITLIVNPWYASPTPARSEAGGLRASLVLDVARHLEGGVSAAMLAWNTLDQPSTRVLGWNILGAHLRGVLPVGPFSLVGTYQQEWSKGSAGYGLLAAGDTAGRASLAAHLPVHSSAFSSLFTVGASAGVSYNPSGAAAVELGLRAAVLPDDPAHHVSLWLEGGVQQPVRGDAGSRGAWGALGFSSLNLDGGGELAGALQVMDSGGALSVFFAVRLKGHFGMGYRPPEFLIRHEDPDELVTALAKQRGPTKIPPPQTLLAGALAAPPPSSIPNFMPPGPQPPGSAPGAAPGPAGLGPAAWYPPGQPVPPPSPPGPTQAHPGSALASYLHPPPLVWGQSARPPMRPPLPSMPRTGLRYERGVEGEPDQRDRVEDEAGYRLNQVRRQANRQAELAPPRGDWEPERDSDYEGPVLRPGHAEHAPPGYRPTRATPVHPVLQEAWERASQAAEHAPPPVRSQPPSTSMAAPAQAVSSSTTRGGGAGPVRQGQRGVERAKQDETAAGGRVKGDEITIELPSGRRRVDVVVEEADGSLTAREVKTGNSPYKPIQRTKDHELETVGGKAVGKNAQKAGLQGPIKIPTKLIRY